MKLSKLITWKRFSLPDESFEKHTELVAGIYENGSPKISILAGVHGDEGPWGSYAIKKLLEKVDVDNLCGSITVVPAANPKAFELDSRVALLDHFDLNRVFPGDLGGSYTERLAALITNNVIEGSDFVIDLHGGGSWCVNAFGFKFRGSEELANMLNPPFLVDAVEKKGSLSNYALERGIKVAALEMGGRCYYEGEWVNKIANRLWNALIYSEILDDEEIAFSKSSKSVGPSSILRSSQGGILLPEINEEAVGTVISKNELLGKLVDPVTFETLESFRSPFHQTAILLLRPRITIIGGGDMIYVVSPLLED